MLGALVLRWRVGRSEAVLKSILISHGSVLNRFTFLGLRTLTLGSSLDPLLRTLDSAALQRFVAAARGQLHVLGRLGGEDIGHADV